MKTKLYVMLCFAFAVGCSDTIADGDPWSVDENAPVEGPTADIEPEPEPMPQPDPTPDPVPFPSELTGNWAQEMIGNCIDETTWLAFADDGEMEHVFADRNACHTHSVTIGTGSWSQLTNHTFEYEWRGDDQWERRRSTFEVRDQTLNLSAYERVGDVFVHENEREGTLRGYYMHTLRVEISFEEPLADDACNMHVEIDAEIDLGGNAAPIVASETFDFDCEKATNEVGSFVIAATSPTGRSSDAWSDVFNEREISDRYGQAMATFIFSNFRPELNLRSPRADIAFMPGIWHAAYQRRADEPPRTVEELDGNN